MPRSTAASAVPGGSFPASAGACQAPQTTATGPSLARPGGVPQRGPQHLAHVRLAALLMQLLVRRGRGRGAHLGHGLGQRGERGLPVHPGLDQVIPPALRVVIPGRGGQHGHRVPLRPGHLLGLRITPGLRIILARPGRPRLASSTEAGRSQNRTGT